jgi:SOS-response transcriptional repressor LexA
VEAQKLPHALTERQKEYLHFIREYIRENEVSPGLDEIARYFGVKPPTAHKILEALKIKGFIFFVRSSGSGFFIRPVERAGMQEVVMHVPVFGRADHLGELVNYPEDLGYFPDFFFGAQPYSIYAIRLTEDIPSAHMRARDLIVFDRNKKPQPDDICIVPIGKRFFLVKIVSKTIDGKCNPWRQASGFRSLRI